MCAHDTWRMILNWALLVINGRIGSGLAWRVGDTPDDNAVIHFACVRSLDRTRGATWRYTNQLATRPSPRSLHQTSYYLHFFPLRLGSWVGRVNKLAACSRLLAVDRVNIEPATSQLRVQYCTTEPLPRGPAGRCRGWTCTPGIWLQNTCTIEIVRLNLQEHITFGNFSFVFKKLSCPETL